MPTSDDYYEHLTPVLQFVDLADPDCYRDVPSSWYVLVADVVGSTQAIRDGRYKSVNMVGAACIVAVVNSLGNTNIPYVFGGDGATILVGPGQVQAARDALGGVAAISQQLFSLQLRVGCVPVADLLERGQRIQVAKLALSQGKTLAMLWGDGVKGAEDAVKSPEQGPRYAVSVPANPSPKLMGLSCRWRPLVSQHGCMFTVIAVAKDTDSSPAAETYREVLQFLEELAPHSRPVTERNAAMGNDLAALDTEASLRTRVTTGLRRWLLRVYLRLETFMARWLMRSQRKLGGFDGATYHAEVVAHSDFRKFDGAIRMVLDVTEAQANKIEAFLTARHSSGRLCYGVHRSERALMTCMVHDTNRDHVHFVDGDDGGYALAAVQLKAQLREG